MSVIHWFCSLEINRGEIWCVQVERTVEVSALSGLQQHAVLLLVGLSLLNGQQMVHVLVS